MNVNIEHRWNNRMDKENPVGLHQRMFVSTKDVDGRKRNPSEC